MSERAIRMATAENAWSELVNDSPAWRVSKNNSGSLQTMHCYYNRQVSGDDGYHYLRYFFDKYLSAKSAISVASFGSGSGFLEPVLYQHGFQGAQIVGYELNPVLVNAANESAVRNGFESLRYEVADLNCPDLPKRKFDVGIFFHSLHHVENLEGCLDSVSDAIRGDGYLLVVEFVGENFQQWTDVQIAQASKILSFLPDKYKTLNDGTLKTTPRRPSVEEVVFHDPSESVRSKDILSVLDAHFDKVELVSLGGSVLNHVFEGIALNFDENKNEDVELIKCLQSLEQWLERAGMVSTDFVLGVYRQKPVILVSLSSVAVGSECKGISQSEGEWRWTDSPVVVIRTPEKLPGDFLLVVDYEGAYETVVDQRVSVCIGGQHRQFVAIREGGCAELLFENVQNCDLIEIKIPNACSPISRGESIDQRVLGIRVKSIAMRVLSC